MKPTEILILLLLLVPSFAGADTCVQFVAVDDWGECGWPSDPFVVSQTEDPPGACTTVDGVTWSITTSNVGWVDCSWVSQPDSGNNSWPSVWTTTYTKNAAGGTCTSPRYPPGWQAWTDAAVTAGSTKIKAAHVNELRTNINLMRANAGLAACAWTDPAITAGTTKIRKIHFDELRTCISQVYTTCGSPAPIFTDAVIIAGSTTLNKTHIDQLRSATSNAP